MINQKRYNRDMETRKHLPRAAISRIYLIDREIAAGKYPNVQDLAKEHEVGTATIYRDIEYMRDMLYAPIEYSAKHRGRFYAEKTFRLPAQFAAADEEKRYKIVFSKEPAPDMLNRLWALDPDNYFYSRGIIGEKFYIEFFSTQYGKVLKWLLSFDDDAQPLEPEELVKEWHWHIGGMRKLAKEEE
jgi:hypothetical protein